jgi:hypothetical protein
MNILSIFYQFLCIAFMLSLAPAAGPPAEEPPVQYAHIGIVPLRDEGNVRDGAEELSAMLAGRLDAYFPEAEFILLDPGEEGFPPGPVLLDEAVEYGTEFGVDALIDGVFGGVEIAGGTWPNAGSDVPMARGELRWRLVECGEGLLVADDHVLPEKHKIYSKRITDTDELVERVMQDLVAAVAALLEERGLVAGTELPESEEDE